MIDKRSLSILDRFFTKEILKKFSDSNKVYDFSYHKASKTIRISYPVVKFNDRPLEGISNKRSFGKVMEYLVTTEGSFKQSKKSDPFLFSFNNKKDISYFKKLNKNTGISFTRQGNIDTIYFIVSLDMPNIGLIFEKYDPDVYGLKINSVGENKPTELTLFSRDEDCSNIELVIF